MAKTENIKELVLELANSLNSFEKFKDYYLGELLPGFVENPSSGTHYESVLLEKIRAELTEEEWATLPRMVADLKAGRWEPTQKEKKLEIERVEREIRKTEEAARIKAEEEARRAEEERRKRAEAKLKLEREKLRKQALDEFIALVESDFLNARKIIEAKYPDVLSAKDIESKLIYFIQNWVKELGRQLPDPEQALAIASVDGDIQVVARAGSGKTTTIVNRALFLQKHCKISPDEILLVAFNKKAAEQIEQKLRPYVGADVPHVMTFHSLAYSLVHPEESLLYDDKSSNNEGLSRAFLQVIDDFLKDDEFHTKVKSVMLTGFRRDWEQIEQGGYHLSEEEFLLYRRSLRNQTLNGEDVKSHGEKVIANFLFEHDVPYKYERNFWWGGENYRPDFTIFKTHESGVIIEYFGMVGEPEYDRVSAKKRAFWKENTSWNLLEVYPRDIKNKSSAEFDQWLALRLEKHGVRCLRLSEDEIWKRAKKRSVDRFTRAMRSFVGRCRQQFLSPDDITVMAQEHSFSYPGERQFVSLAGEIYSAYLDRLKLTGQEDFDGLIQKAVAEVSNGNTRFTRKGRSGNLKNLRFVFVDEYQDFSELFNRLLQSLRTQNPSANFFCVGDDWQAINAFAGSDLRFFAQFESYFCKGAEINISTNYRSRKSVVSTGNHLMKRRGIPAKASTERAGAVRLCDMNRFSPTEFEQEKHSYDAITPAVLRILYKELGAGNDVAIISRTNTVPWSTYSKNWKYGPGLLDLFSTHLRGFLFGEDKKRVSCHTAHSFKGGESDAVVILDAKNRRYPLIHPDWVYNRILGDDEKKLLDEERRLFYVALTRARKSLYIITDTSNMSPFLNEFSGFNEMRLLNWEALPKFIQADEALRLVRIKNADQKSVQATMAIKDQLQASGYQFGRKDDTPCWWRVYPNSEGLLDELKNQVWAGAAQGVVVQIWDIRDRLQNSFLVQGPTWTLHPN